MSMFQGERPVGTVGDDADAADDGRSTPRKRGGSAWVDPDIAAADRDAAGSSEWIRDEPASPAEAARPEGSRPSASDYEARIADLEATVAELRAELAVRAEERRALVDHYESIIQEDGDHASGRHGPSGPGATGTADGLGVDADAEVTSDVGASTSTGTGTATATGAGDQSLRMRVKRAVRSLLTDR
jgi:hypothetical protein